MKDSPRKAALESIRGLADQALRARLARKRAPPPKPVAPETRADKSEEELDEDDTRRLMELYSSDEE